MIASKEVRPLEHSSVELTVTVEKESAQKEYEELVAKYARTIAIPGFRRGKVPVAVLVQKYGESLIEEASANLLESSLESVFDSIEKKPLPYATPKLKDDAKIEPGKDFTFTVTYDTFPDFSVTNYRGIEVTEPDVTIAEADVLRELEELRDRNATVIDKAEGGTVERNDVVTVNFVELDEAGAERAPTRREDFVFTVGTGYNVYRIDDDIVGMHKGDERTVAKDYPAGYEYPELAGKSVSLRVKVVALKEKQLPALDDEFAQDVNDKFHTVDDLKNDAREHLQRELATALRRRNVSAIIDQLSSRTVIDLPDSMIDAELHDTWHAFADRNRLSESQLLGVLENQGQSREKLFDEWRPQAEHTIKAQLILGKVAELEQVKVETADLDAEFERRAKEMNQSVEALKATYERLKLVHRLEHDIETGKVYDLLVGSAVIKKGAKVDFVDLVQEKQ